jgi:hypothetical protein
MEFRDGGFYMNTCSASPAEQRYSFFTKDGESNSGLEKDRITSFKKDPEGFYEGTITTQCGDTFRVYRDAIPNTSPTWFRLRIKDEN